MKTNLFKRTCAGILLGAACTFGVNAANYTAVTSGNWTDAATWGGTAPTGTLTLDNVSIPAGITVTLDIDVTFTGLINTFDVNGTLDNANSSTLTIAQGGLGGNGTIDIHKLVFTSLLATMSFDGDLNAAVLTNDNALLSVVATVTVTDTLDLMNGSVSIANGGNLTLQADAVIRVEDGTLGITGGVFAGSDYDVVYVGGSKTAGVELNSTSLRNVRVDLDANTESITLANNLIVNGTLALSQGDLQLVANRLTIRGDVQMTSGSELASTVASDIVIEAGNLNGGLMFTTGSAVNELTIDLDSTGVAKLMSTLNVAGELRLTSGWLHLESNGDLTMNANSKVVKEQGGVKENGGLFVGTASYDVEYRGDADSAGVELSGTGLNNVLIELAASGDAVMIDRDVEINGALNMNRGNFSLNGYKLTLSGTVNQTGQQSMFWGNNTSRLVLDLTASSNDTLTFAATGAELEALELNLTTAGIITLGADLKIFDDVKLASGTIELGDHNLMLESSAGISQHDDNNYIRTSGNGHLEMNVNTSAPYVVFPVGTTTGYSPAHIQQNAAGTSGKFMVRVKDGVYSAGDTGTNQAITKSVVNHTWLIEAASGVNANMKLKLGWTAGAERNSFDRNIAYISHYTNNAWDKNTVGQATTGNNNTFEITRDNITSLSPFVVTDSSSSLKVQEIKGAIAMSIYPNPAADFLNVNVKDANAVYQYDVMDLNGRSLMTATNNEMDNRFNISGLTEGCYFIKVTNLANMHTTTSRFVKF